MYDREHEVIENRVDDLNVSAHLGGLTIRLEDDGPEDRWASLDVSWETLSEWYARLNKARPGEDDPAIKEAIKIHDDHKAALGGTYDTCRSPSCWAAGKILAAVKGVNLGQPVSSPRPARSRRK
jgi:hypothetical protein